MRDLTVLDRFRVELPKVFVDHGLPPLGDAKNGAFAIPLSTERIRLAGSRPGEVLRVLASSGGGWDHVSVSLDHRAPTWEEMSFVHRVFFKEDEVAWQYHVPMSDHINMHPYTLHIWRKLGSHFRMPMPPKEFV